MKTTYPVVDRLELKLRGRSKRLFQLLKFACCDCGLVHDIGLAIEKNGNLGIALRRNNRATGQLRRQRRDAKHRQIGDRS